MGKLVDLTGNTFGYWTVLGRDENNEKKNIHWICKCKCGTVRSVSGTSLRGGISVSCGCLKDKKTSERNRLRCVDMSGQRIGKWTVLRMDDSKERTAKIGTRWICRCDCGKEKSVSGYSLRNGTSLSCGCDSSNRIKDLTGQRFGCLFVLKQYDGEYDKKRGIKWVCRCDCGNEFVTLSGRLVSGQTKSCGCMYSSKGKHADINEGDIFGWWTVISYTGEKGRGKRYLCRCKCGRERVVEAGALKRGATQSCGCRRAEVKDDISENRYYRLTVVGRVKADNGEWKWKCKCDCGNTVLANKSQLEKGKIKSCGCLSRENSFERKFIDLTNQRFGKLVVQRVDHIEKDRLGSGTYYWLCKCDCGNEKVVQGDVLKRGHTVSCGCYQSIASANRAKTRTIDLLGRRFGLLTVISREANEKNVGQDYSFWKCKCDCGNYKNVEGYHLTHGYVASCGCLKQSKLELYVSQYFDSLGMSASVDYDYQKRFNELRGYDDGILSYDFAIYESGEVKILIECQGQQHFFPVEMFGGEEQFAKQQLHDELKRKYALEHKIRLIEIPYTMDTYDKVASFLEKNI